MLSDINWTLYLLAAASGVVVGCIVLAIGMHMDKRREDKRLAEEACAMQAEMEDGGE